MSPTDTLARSSSCDEARRCGRRVSDSDCDSSRFNPRNPGPAALRRGNTDWIIASVGALGLTNKLLGARLFDFCR